MSNKLKLKKEDFQLFLNGLAKVSDTAILYVTDDSMHAITASEDRSLFLWSSLDGDYGVNTTLNLPSLKKLSKSLDLIGTSDLELVVNPNNLEFKGNKIKFKYHLYSDGILVAPRLTLSKIESLKYDFEFECSKQFMASILKNSSIFKDTNKLYIYTEDDNLIWSLGDKTQINTDVLTMVGESVDFEMEEFIINLDNMRLLSYANEQILKFRINDMGIGNIQLKNGDVQLNYILSSLTK